MNDDIVFWMGKRLDSLTKEELMEAFQILYQQYNSRGEVLQRMFDLSKRKEDHKRW